MNAPKVERARRSKENYLEYDRVVQHSYKIKDLRDLLSKYDDGATIQIYAEFDGCFVNIFKDEYLETEQEWKDRVESEVKALNEWTEAKKVALKELAEKQRIETIKKLEERLRVLKGEG